MIEYPFPPRRKIGSSARDVKRVVGIETNRIGFPLHCVNVKISREPPAFGQLVGRSYSISCAVAGPVQGSVHCRRFLANILHDVDLAASGPARLADVIT